MAYRPVSDTTDRQSRSQADSDAHIEGNLATEVSMVILDTLEQIVQVLGALLLTNSWYLASPCFLILVLWPWLGSFSMNTSNLASKNLQYMPLQWLYSTTVLNNLFLQYDWRVRHAKLLLPFYEVQKYFNCRPCQGHPLPTFHKLTGKKNNNDKLQIQCLK